MMCSKVFSVGRALTGALRCSVWSDVLNASPARLLLPVQRFRFSDLLTAPQVRLCSQITANQSAEQDPALLMSEAQSEVTAEDSSEPDKLYKRIELEVRGHDPAVLKSYKWYAMEAAKLLDISVSRTWQPKHVNERWTLLKAPFGKKKHMVQYEMRTYFQFIELKHLTGSTADTYLEYIQRNLPEGVAMKVTKTTLERLPSYIKPPAHETSDARPALQEDTSK
ncbi:28S ribosomal protein S10, mitochondrial-like [Dermacentor silvarum]|uniref:28S ribosomal protein S10, mitochondrial-like n=1 Tax=Dermacentor silvarum TaxID=543639 RepID=UPI001897DB03|nr:28S ribosomal protein S10, mitochondrial-like [Dermacentor silvarum]